MRHVLLFALVVATACGGSSSKVSNLPAGTTVVDLHAGATGTETTVRFGSFVAWRSADGLQHTITSTGFTDVDVPAGGVSTAVAITPAGTYQYSCSVHGAASESGSVRILPPGS
jgi:plastocyanin